MSKENSQWGASRIHGELLMLGFEVAQSTVSKYMVRGGPSPSQSWKTFLRNHAEAIAAIDMCVVPTLTFDHLFAFLVLSHGRRPSGWRDRSPKPSPGHQRRPIWCATMTVLTDMSSRPGRGPWVSAIGRSHAGRRGKMAIWNA
jgi:hypothetical protein